MKCKKNFKNLDKYRSYRERYKTRYRQRTGAYKYKPREWTVEELRMVKAHKITDRELSEKIKRSISAIQMARYRIKTGHYDIS